jgi:hypothetical protein
MNKHKKKAPRIDKINAPIMSKVDNSKREIAIIRGDVINYVFTPNKLLSPAQLKARIEAYNKSRLPVQPNDYKTLEHVPDSNEET